MKKKKPAPPASNGGRPVAPHNVGLTRRFWIRVSEDEFAELTALAQSESRSASSLARVAVLAYLDRSGIQP